MQQTRAQLFSLSSAAKAKKMVQIRHGDGIEGFKGGFGGVYFGKDASGQHMRKKPRTTKRTPSPAQDLQRKWYSSKKWAERHGYPDEGFPDEEIPPGIYVIYSLETLWGHRQPSFSKPELKQVEYAGFYPDAIRDWINLIWNPRWTSWGLTKDLMFMLTIRYFYICKWTWGFGGAGCFTFAKAWMLNWISATAASVAVPILGLWLGIIGIGLVFGFLSWLEGCDGHLNFNVGRIIIRRGHRIWWGGLVGRMSHKMYDIGVCGQTPFEGCLHHETPAPYPYRINWFDINKLWQTADRGIIYSHIYSWKQLRCRFRGMAYQIAPQLVRMRVKESQHDFWKKPIGWNITLEQACAYVGQIHDYFRCAGDPGPPL